MLIGQPDDLIWVPQPFLVVALVPFLCQEENRGTFHILPQGSVQIRYELKVLQLRLSYIHIPIKTLDRIQAADSVNSNHSKAHPVPGV